MSETKHGPVMTPEERARFCASLFLDPAKVSSEKRARVEREIAAAIREAVKAETEACAKIAKAEQRDASTGGAYAVWNRACNRIANRIRERTP